tara:strand:+ start:5196 stop:5534 length:339 start_codon:yes stop_codon:yes gene_type:complete
MANETLIISHIETKNNYIEINGLITDPVDQKETPITLFYAIIDTYFLTQAIQYDNGKELIWVNNYLITDRTSRTTICVTYSQLVNGEIIQNRRTPFTEETFVTYLTTTLSAK